MNVIEISGLTKTYKGGWFSKKKNPSLDHLDLTVPGGKIFGFLGPNGAGKSTTIKILLGLVHPSGGSAKILGEPITRQRGPLADRVSSGESVVPIASAGGGVSADYGKGPQGGRRRSECPGRWMSALTGIKDRADSGIREFSRGMLQRLGISQALINRPELVILDEPLNGLDPYGRRDLKRIFLELKSSGCTVFFSSHILSDAEDLCDHVSILNKGKLIADGDTKELLSEQPGMSLEEYFFHKVDEDNKKRFGASLAEQTLESIRRESVESSGL